MQIRLHRMHPVPTRGASAIVTNVGRGCGGRESCDSRARLKRTAKPCGSDAAGLASMHLEATAFRALRCPVCSCAHSFYPLHMRPRVQRASGIPCALFSIEGEELHANLGRNAPREYKTGSPTLPATT